MQYITLNNADNVAVALEALEPGFLVEASGNSIEIKETIPAGHKFALNDIAQGANIVKYGARIGMSTQDITPGFHVHVHNVKTALAGLDEYTYTPDDSIHAQPQASTLSFQGYRRPDGKVGTRNEVWILSTVGCVAKLAEKIAYKANERFGDKCDGVFAYTHPFGCSQTGDDHNNTKMIMSALAQHPNAGAVLVIGLGCENNQGNALLATIPEERRERISFFNSQNVDDEQAEGLDRVEKLVDLIAEDKRETCPLSDLVIGMKCGGSDGFSGLSANSAVGRISDRVAEQGGSVLLTETPEMFGAEQILMNRSSCSEVFEKSVNLINDFKKYFINHGENIYDNPSPGNKDGGITTLEEKSMGAIQKGGTATVTGVLDYAEPIKVKGLNLLQSPGNDAVSSTALTASGATIILFTTGRGTPLGFPAPTIKISSNSRLAKEKSKWIDFDAGCVFELQNLDLAADKLMSTIIDIASGVKQTRSEINDQREIAIWKNGVTL